MERRRRKDLECAFKAVTRMTIKLVMKSLSSERPPTRGCASRILPGNVDPDLGDPTMKTGIRDRDPYSLSELKRTGVNTCLKAATLIISNRDEFSNKFSKQ